MPVNFFGEFMSRSRNLMLSMMLATASLAVQAQSVQTLGTQVIVPASGEIIVPNDQVRATLMIEEQDKDKVAAASRVNQKMKQGIDIVKRQDPQAVLKSHGYFTYAIYSDETPRNAGKARQIVGWRVGQYLDVVTSNLAALPKTVAAAQGILALNGLQFGLTPESVKKQDAALIDATYKNLNERLVAIARAMGRNPGDASLETVDFEGSGNYAGSNDSMPKAMMMRAAAPVREEVAEPSFEPGESTLSMRLVGKVKFK